MDMFQHCTNKLTMTVTSMMNKLHGQPDSYDKKYILPRPPPP